MLAVTGEQDVIRKPTLAVPGQDAGAGMGTVHMIPVADEEAGLGLGAANAHCGSPPASLALPSPAAPGRVGMAEDHILCADRDVGLVQQPLGPLPELDRPDPGWKGL